MSQPVSRLIEEASGARPDSVYSNLSALLDIHGIARCLGTSERHVRRLVAERRIPYLKVGGFVRFDEAEIKGWLDATRVAVGRIG